MSYNYKIRCFQASLSYNHAEIIILKNSSFEDKHARIALLDRESGALKREIERLLNETI